MDDEFGNFLACRTRMGMNKDLAKVMCMERCVGLIWVACWDDLYIKLSGWVYWIGLGFGKLFE